MKIGNVMKTTAVLVSLLALLIGCNQQERDAKKSNPATDMAYWSVQMKSNPADAQLNAFSFEEKYNIIEYAYNKIGLHCNYSFEQISAKLKNESAVGDELFNEENQINRLAYWVLGLWGSSLNMPTAKKAFNYIKLSDQAWFFEGEQGDLNYQSYVDILHAMRRTKNSFSNWNEKYVEESNAYKIDFKYKQSKKNWNVANEVGGSINNKIFNYYTELCEKEYIEKGNYFLIMEGGGGYALFLTYEAEAYLRALWDFPKLNKRGRMMSLWEYGNL